MTSTHSVGERLSYDGALCTVRYVGEVAGAKGSWLGVEWDDPTRGKHDGQHKGVRYFQCKIPSPTAASFVRPTRPVEEPLDFLSALSEKYASEVTREQVPIASEKQIVISGKVAEEVGFDKIRRKLAQLGELKIVILDGMRVASAYAPTSSPEPGVQRDDRRKIKNVCPRVTELDLSRNLFNRFRTVVEICAELSELNSLRINGNRFNTIPDDDFQGAEMAFKGVKELAMGEMVLGWEDLCRIASKFPAINSLLAGTNRLSSLYPIPFPGLASTLTSLNLEFNDFTSFSDIEALTVLTSLRTLHLKGNNITSIVSPSQPGAQAPVFSTNLHYLDLSYNQVLTWSFTDALPTSFPGLTSLRFSHNPIYDNPNLEALSSSGGAPTPSAPQTGKPAPPTDESYMLTLGRLPDLRALNFSTVTAADRTNADMFYLSRIARQLAAAPAAQAAAVLAHHRRWAELCDAYGEPAVVRLSEVNPNFLEARLVGVEFYLARTGLGPVEKNVEIPKSVDIYAVKGIAGRLFDLSPLRLRLVWETGEWDPVAGFDEEDDDSSDEAEHEAELEADKEREAEEEASKNADADAEAESQSARKAGRWVKREVELKDGPRQFGYCVDGLEARIRVEVI